MRGLNLSCAPWVLCLVCGLGCPGCKKKRPPMDDDQGFKGPKVLRKMKLSGSWYERDPERLSSALDGYLVQAGVPRLKGRLVGLLSPHAGYRYSGPTAAHGFKLLGKQRGIRRIITLGISHKHAFRGVSIPQVTHYETPLGLLRLDQRAVSTLRSQTGYTFVTRMMAHDLEHSLELQMPFLKHVRPKVRIVPMLVGAMTPAERLAAARAIAPLLDQGTVLLASSDFTHRGGRFRFEVQRRSGESVAQATRRLDFGTLPFIRALDAEGLLRYHRDTGITMCGRGPTALMLASLKAAGLSVTSHVLHYTTSGNVTKNWSSSVSYLSVALMSSK